MHSHNLPQIKSEHEICLQRLRSTEKEEWEQKRIHHTSLSSEGERRQTVATYLWIRRSTTLNRTCTVWSHLLMQLAESLQCTGNQMLETGVKPIKPWYRVFGAASVRENKESTGSQISKGKKGLAGVMRSLQRSREDTGNEIIPDHFMAGCLCVKGGNCKVVGLLIFSWTYFGWKGYTLGQI